MCDEQLCNEPVLVHICPSIKHQQHRSPEARCGILWHSSSHGTST